MGKVTTRIAIKSSALLMAEKFSKFVTKSAVGWNYESRRSNYLV